jgi:hypothetical protein
MGFDLYINLTLPIDQNSGLPYVYTTDNSKKPYSPSDFCVPEKHRLWLKQRGHIFHYYIRDIDGSDTMNTLHTEAFLEKYPEWEDIKSSMELDGEDEESYGWTEKDHTEFKEALQWFSSKEYFSISWSY